MYRCMGAIVSPISKSSFGNILKMISHDCFNHFPIVLFSFVALPFPSLPFPFPICMYVCVPSFLPFVAVCVCVGGGNGGNGGTWCGSGGGASDVRIGGGSLYNRVIVAGGGGGQCGTSGSPACCV